jgi:hypothetical protein
MLDASVPWYSLRSKNRNNSRIEDIAREEEGLVKLHGVIATYRTIHQDPESES